MNNIKLKKIDETNFIDAFNLKLGQGQNEFVSHPVRSLAQAYVYYKQCTPFGIYRDNSMIGYVMVIYDYELEEYDIWHLMIDEKYQHKGYGTLAMQKCFEYISTKPFGSSIKVALTCSVKNITAINLYKNLGFIETRAIDEDEIELALMLK